MFGTLNIHEQILGGLWWRAINRYHKNRRKRVNNKR